MIRNSKHTIIISCPMTNNYILPILSKMKKPQYRCLCYLNKNVCLLIRLPLFQRRSERLTGSPETHYCVFLSIPVI